MKKVRSIGQWVLVALALALLPVLMCIMTNNPCESDTKVICSYFMDCD